MYIPPPYQEHRQEVLVGAIRQRGFGTLASFNAGQLHVSHLPFVLAGAGEELTLIAHLARANPQWRGLAGTEAAATFLIDDAYISPGWYPSKQDAGRVVPTWNYIAVEARGQMEVVEDAEGLLALLEPLTAAHENHRPRPWTVAEAPADYLAALLKGIVGIRMVAPVLTGAWKLDQKKAAADRLGAAAGLRRDEGAEGIAGWMEQV